MRSTTSYKPQVVTRLEKTQHFCTDKQLLRSWILQPIKSRFFSPLRVTLVRLPPEVQHVQQCQTRITWMYIPGIVSGLECNSYDK
jgi:hypothetical protein